MPQASSFSSKPRRVLATHAEALGRALRFVFFSGEEVGLVGSERYVKQHRAELENVRFMLNLDGPGRREEVGVAVQGWDDLVVQAARHEQAHERRLAD